MMMGLVRSATMGEMQGRRQNAVAGWKREAVIRRNEYKSAMAGSRVRGIVWRLEECA
jgi:hypothetical protein